MLSSVARALRQHRCGLFLLAGLILALQVSRSHVHWFGEHDVLYSHSHATEMHVLDMDMAADHHGPVGETAVIDDLLIKFSSLGLFIPMALLFLLLAMPRALGLRAPPSLTAHRLSFNALRPPLRAPPR